MDKPKRGDVDELGAAIYPHLSQNVPDGFVTQYQRQQIARGKWPGSLPDGVFGHMTAHPTSIEVVDESHLFLYSQGDPKWARRILGRNRTFRQAGCLVCCLAMWMTYHMSADMTSDDSVSPEDLDEYLDANKGYWNDSVVWDVALSIFPEPLTRRKETTPGTFITTIQDNLPIIARVDYGRDKDLLYNHFVLIIGILPGPQYAIADPATWRGNFFRWMVPDNVLETTRRKGGYNLVALEDIRKTS